MTRACDLTGQRFGRLVALNRTKKGNLRGTFWLCQCDCGNQTIVATQNLKQGQIRSCGCLLREARKSNCTHGMSDTRLFYVWNNMKNRCNWKKHKDYHNYGGRGIRVCDEWLHDFGTFASWALANGYDENAPYGACTLDRIDPDKDYEPSNCRFADSFVQANNRRDRHLKGELVQDRRGVFHVSDNSSEVA